jgi:hypothetical protein
MLQSVPDHLEQVAISMEILLDLDVLLIEEVAGHLQAVESHQKKKAVLSPSDTGRQLLLMEDQWKVWSKVSVGEKLGGCGNNSNGSGGGGSRGRGHGRGGARGDTRADSLGMWEEGGGSDGLSEKCCFRCGKPGHFTWECRSKKKTGETHLAQEEESALMLIECGEIHFESNSQGVCVAPKPIVLPSKSTLVKVVGVRGLSMSTSSPVHLVEEKVFAHFSDEEKDSKCWVLDSGASNHMTGVRDAFTELDSNVRRTVKFGDGSVMLFIYKNG